MTDNTNSSLPTEGERRDKQFIESVFVAKQQLRSLNESTSETAEQKQGTPRLLFNDLVYCACCPNTSKSQLLLARINESLPLRAQYRWVLEKVSMSISDVQIAASTNTAISYRETDVFSLNLKADPLQSAQMYVVLTLKDAALAQYRPSDSATMPAVFLHCLRHDEFRVLTFPEFTQGRTQCLIETTSDIYDILSDEETQIFLQASQV
jgi:hypothetical protein